MAIFMKFYGNASLYSNAQNKALIAEDGCQISYVELKDQADKIGLCVWDRSLIFFICSNEMASIAGYLGFLSHQRPMVLINDAIEASLFANLLKTYQPGYIFAPRAFFFGSSFVGTEVYADRGYILLRTDFATCYDIHEDLAVLLTTSGSTGSPKLVRLSYSNIDSNTEAIASFLKIDENDRAITTMPMSYSYGLSIVNTHLSKGACLVLTKKSFLQKEFWQTMREAEVTTFGGVPYMFEILQKLRFNKMDLPALQYITQAGGKLSANATREFIQVCEAKGYRFITMYGQTEATARMSYLSWDKANEKLGSIGKPIPKGNFYILNENEELVVGSGIEGELVYEGPNVSMGYAFSYEDLYKGDENKGVLRTGDIARRCEEGYYYIVGRKNRFLKMFGNRVNLDEVEQLIAAEFASCICLGSDDNMQIFLEIADQHYPDQEIKKFIFQKTGIHSSFVSIKYVPKFPRTANGKIKYSAFNLSGEVQIGQNE